MPAFARDQIEGGVPAKRINRTVFLLDANNIRLDWNAALAINHGAPIQIVGYSDVLLKNDGTLRGVDYSLG
jgi:hypothetical protein